MFTPNIYFKMVKRFDPQKQCIQLHLQRCLTSLIFWDTQTKSTMRHLTLIRWKNLKDWQYQVAVKMGETVTPVTATTETVTLHTKLHNHLGKVWQFLMG